MSSGESQSMYALTEKDPWKGVSITKVSWPNI